MGRPRKENALSERLEFRVSTVDKARIEERARAAGMRLPEFLRARALGLKPRGLVPIAPPPAPVREPVNPVIAAKAVERQEVADEIAEAMLDDPAARDAFLERRTKWLIGHGNTSLVARRMAAAEWANRGQRVAQPGRGT